MRRSVQFLSTSRVVTLGKSLNGSASVVKVEGQGDPTSREVSVQLEASLVSIEDLRTTHGHSRFFPKADNPGSVASGVVTSVGTAVKNFGVGDVVVASATQGMSVWRRHVTFNTDSSTLFKAPSSLTTLEAIYLPPLLSAHKILSRTEKGDIVAINHPDSALGRAIQDLVNLMRTLGPKGTLIVCHDVDEDLSHSCAVNIPVASAIFQDVTVEGFHWLTWSNTRREEVHASLDALGPSLRDLKLVNLKEIDVKELELEDGVQGLHAPLIMKL